MIAKIVIILNMLAATRGAYNSVCAKAQSNIIVLAPPALCAHKSQTISSFSLAANSISF